MQHPRRPGRADPDVQAAEVALAAPALGTMLGAIGTRDCDNMGGRAPLTRSGANESE